jgi:hypothetical protein
MPQAAVPAWVQTWPHNLRSLANPCQSPDGVTGATRFSVNADGSLVTLPVPMPYTWGPRVNFQSSPGLN